jgi:membrane-associated phospholipid phosphatase
LPGDGKLSPLSAGVRRRAVRIGGGCAVLLAGVYLLAVWTPAGQRFEDAVLRAAELAGGASAARTLNTFTVSGLVAATVAVLAIGLLRRRPLLAGLATGVIAASVLTTELLQRSVLRPILIEHGRRRDDQSFPSGHATVAMAVMCALVLVAPYRFRGAAVLLTSAGAASVGVATVTAGWHRPSDTIGSDLIVVIYACVAVAVLARLGRVGEATPGTSGGRAARTLLVVGYAVVGVVAFGVTAAVIGSIPDDLNVSQFVGPSVLTGGRAAALSGTAAVALALLALLRRVDLNPTDREIR